MHHSCVWVFTVEEMMSMENVRRKMIEENINDERIYSSANWQSFQYFFLFLH